MNHSTPGLPVYHQLSESTQTHVHWVSGAIQSTHSLSSPSPPGLNLSQHQGLFKWVSCSHQVAKDWSFSFNISPSSEHPESPLGWTGWISLQSKGLSRVFSNTTVQKHQFRNHLDRNLYSLLLQVIFQEDFVFFNRKKKSSFRLVPAYIHCETIVIHLIKVTVKDFKGSLVS